MRILFATAHDPEDRRAYSGTTFHMHRALARAGAHVVPFGPLRAPGGWWRKPRKLALHALGYEHARYLEPGILHAYAAQLGDAARAHRADIVVASGGHVVGGLRTVPFACWNDATFGALTRLYPRPRPFSPATERNGHALERALARHATALAYSSEWARASAVATYGAPEAHTAAIPYGANLDAPPAAAAVAAALAARPVGPDVPLTLLFVGKDFERKGGPHALAVALALHRRGVPVRLHVVGPARLPDLPPFVVAEGFLDAQREAGRQRLSDLYARAHLFVFPTRADCTPMVLAEAMAYGVPCLTTDVGGIGSQIPAGTGLLLPPDASADAWADAVLAAWQSPDAYRTLARAARARYDEALNWDVAAARMLSFLDERLRSLPRSS